MASTFVNSVNNTSGFGSSVATISRKVKSVTSSIGARTVSGLGNLRQKLVVSIVLILI